MVCHEDHMTKYFLHLPDVRSYVKQGKPSSQHAILTNPFPAPQQMVSKASVPPSGGDPSSSTTILIIDIVIGIST